MNYQFDNNIPIYIQLLDNIKTDIICGKLKPGEKLSSVRELSTQFKVNPNTMQKALSELETEKLIYTERTNGKYVTEDEKLIEKIKKDYAKKITNDYFEKMQKIGINDSEIIKYINRKENT